MWNVQSSRLIAVVALVSLWTAPSAVVAHSSDATSDAIVMMPRPAEGAPSTAHRSVALSPRDVELLKAQLEATRAEVVALAARADAIHPGAERNALQSEIECLKFEGEASFLRLQADLARRCGDYARATLAEQVLTNIFSPPPLVADAPQTKELPAVLNQSADDTSVVPWYAETDVRGDQRVRSPLSVAWGAPVQRARPPERGIRALPSSDRVSFERNPNYAWVVSIAGRNPADDYDLYVYDDYVGSTSGFSSLRGQSLVGSNATDFVVGHYSGTPTTVYPAAVRFDPGGGGSDFAQDQIDARFRNAPATATFENQVLTPNRLADVYEALLDPGDTVHFVLRRESGSSDLEFAIFPGTGGFIGGIGQALAGSLPVDPTSDVADFTPTITAWYPIVVYRTHGTVADASVTYSFVWESSTSVDVPAKAFTRTVGAGVGAGAGTAVVHATKGDEVVLEPGQAINVHTNAPLTVTVAGKY